VTDKLLVANPRHPGDTGRLSRRRADGETSRSLQLSAAVHLLVV
jgi:hypothetical protein